MRESDMTQLRRLIDGRRGVRNTKKLLRRYKQRMKRRTETTWRERWAAYGGANEHLLCQLAHILELPNEYIYPTDRALLLLANPYPDMREVEALMLIEDHLGREFSLAEAEQLDICPRYMHEILN